VPVERYLPEWAKRLPGVSNTLQVSLLKAADYMDVRARWQGVTDWVDVNYPWLLIILPIVFGLIVVAIYRGPEI
jgi:hypothetical protein